MLDSSGDYDADIRREKPRRCDGDEKSSSIRERLRAYGWRAKVVAFIGAVSWRGVGLRRLGTNKRGRLNIVQRPSIPAVFDRFSIRCWK